MSEHEANRIMENLYENYYELIINFCMKNIGNESRFIPLIEESVHEAFFAFIENYAKLANHPNKAGWLYLKAWNLVRSGIRTTKNHEHIIMEIAFARLNDPKVLESAIDEWLQSDEFNSEIERIHKTLTDIEKPVFDSYFIEDKSMEETAKLNGLSNNSVRAAIERIRKRTRKNHKEYF